MPVLIAAAAALMLLGRTDPMLATQARMAVADALAPLFTWIGAPVASARGLLDEAEALLALRADNTRLKQENETLRRWRSVALTLEAENAGLKANLRWVPDLAARFVTARVIADAGGVYARAVLLSAGPDQGIAKGQVALDDRGLVGRVTELGRRSARVLLLTDINSRIPVTLEASRARAILLGVNGPRPRLMYWPEGVSPAEGERVVTSAEAGAFPAGLPVGVVRYNASNVPEVEPAARLDRLEIVRVFDYAPPDLPARTSERIAAERRR